jgi:hypothetical protein
MAALGNARLSQIIQTYESKKVNDNDKLDTGRHTNKKFIGVLFPRPYEWGGNHGRTR